MMFDIKVINQNQNSGWLGKHSDKAKGMEYFVFVGAEFIQL